MVPDTSEPDPEGESEPIVESGLLSYPLAEWFLLTGDRLVVSAGLLAVVAALLWGSVLTGVAPLIDRTPTLFLLFALIGGNFTLITIVVSISQFVLARHLESPGEIREQMREIIGYRQDVGDLTRESVLPVTPAGFVLLLFRSIGRDAQELRSGVSAATDPGVRTDVEELAEDLTDHAAHVVALVEQRDGALRPALYATLNTNYSRYFYEAYRLRAAYGSNLPDRTAEALSGIERQIEQVDVARRYFKTVLIQSELSSLTRLLLCLGLPVQVASVVLMLVFTTPGSEPIPRGLLAFVLPLVVTAGFAPFVVLTAYIVRLATVVQRTAAMYPFTTAEG
ncbi:MAG: hypothetical protein ABEH56_04190 [Salinirussus sp.]